MAVELHNLLETLRWLVLCEGNTMRSKALAVQSLLEMTENRAKECQISGHSPYFVCNHLQIDKAAATEHDSLHVLVTSFSFCSGLGLNLHTGFLLKAFGPILEPRSVYP
jgi:endonuclease IV